MLTDEVETCRQWADDLEKLRTPDNRATEADPWTEGGWPPSSATTHLLSFDGVHSHSRLSRLQRSLSALFDGGGRAAVTGFSYSRYGKQYGTAHTRRPVPQIAQNFADYVAELPADHRCIPVAFSLGAAVAVWGIDDWLTSIGRSADARERLPTVILIAPGTAPHPCLAAGYKTRNASTDEDVPWAVRNLCQEGMPSRERLNQALARVARRLDVHVIFSEHDRLTPFPAYQRAGVKLCPVPDPAEPPDPRDAVRFHSSVAFVETLRPTLSPACAAYLQAAAGPFL